MTERAFDAPRSRPIVGPRGPATAWRCRAAQVGWAKLRCAKTRRITGVCLAPQRNKRKPLCSEMIVANVVPRPPRSSHNLLNLFHFESRWKKMALESAVRTIINGGSRSLASV
jgi:hypothetical protein